jgi:hypothetical protein
MVEDSHAPELPQEAPVSDEPFACPHCGQMLAASVRVCPSCKKVIDPNDIDHPEIAVPVSSHVISTPPREYARFSWSIFFATLGIWLVAALISQGLLGIGRSQFVLAGLVVLSSAWVYSDARKNHIPTPFRWSLGSVLLWIIIFPWYLARRRTPGAACPFIEGEIGRVTRTFLLILLFLFLISFLMMLLKGPRKASSGGKTPTPHRTAAPTGKIAVLTNSTPVQVLVSAPSEALQT